MPNYCNYEMRLVGEKENLIKAYNIIKADYDYKEDGTVECDADKHLFRIFECEYEGYHYGVNSAEEAIEKYSDGNALILSGNCAWSVYSCMFEGESTYYSQWTEERKAKYECFKGTTIDRISKEFELDIEIFSEEGGCGFMEHYLINNGEIIIDDCIDYHEDYDEETDEYTPVGGLAWEYAI